MNRETLLTPSQSLITTCNGQGLRVLIKAALAWFEVHHRAVNKLNVYPVPDGDTGTNMLLTLHAAFARVAEDESQDVGSIAQRIAEGALFGSRGNSGTVLSQFFRGFADALRGEVILNATLLAKGLRAAVREGYATFQRPVEGTILTVAREIAEAVESAVRHTHDLREIIERAVSRGRESVAKTPEMLPILKQAGVVDSGGQGLLVMFEGMLRWIYGLAGIETPEGFPELADTPIAEAQLNEAFALSDEHGEDGFGFDVQYVIRGQNLNVDAIRSEIQALGKSPIVVGDPTLVKVHVHVHDPEIALAYGRSQGKIADIVVEDMQAQSAEYLASRIGIHTTIKTNGAAPSGHIAVIAVAPGEGLRRIFHNFGATAVVGGGQTMNPSAGSMIEAIRDVPANQIILLPNNPNVILTARQAAENAHRETGKLISVVPTRTVPQGIAAMLSFFGDGEFDVVRREMEERSQMVTTGEITTATRDLELNGLAIQQGDYLGLIDDVPAVSGTDLTQIVLSLLEKLQAEKSEIITLYYGSDVRADAADELNMLLSDRYPEQTIEMIAGEQPLYFYYLSVE